MYNNIRASADHIYKISYGLIVFGIARAGKKPIYIFRFSRYTLFLSEGVKKQANTDKYCLHSKN